MNWVEPLNTDGLCEGRSFRWGVEKEVRGEELLVLSGAKKHEDE